MKSSHISINGIPMCGIVGDEGFSAYISRQELWLRYCKYFREDVAEGDICFLPEYAVWTVNGEEFNIKAWLINLEV